MSTTDAPITIDTRHWESPEGQAYAGAACDTTTFHQHQVLLLQAERWTYALGYDRLHARASVYQGQAKVHVGHTDNLGEVVTLSLGETGSRLAALDVQVTRDMAEALRDALVLALGAPSGAVVCENTFPGAVVEWCCDACGAWNPEGAPCACGTTEASWLPIEPQRRDG